ncbi:MAG: aspartate--tRNA ligase [Nanoarchaeota archaeon]
MTFTLKRTHKCSELRKTDVKKTVSLNGWVHNRRDHGGIIFIDLRDRYGLTQIVFDPQFKKDCHKKAEELRREDVIAVKGVVYKRKEGMNNPNLDTGEIEVYISELEILSKAKTPPLEVDDRIVANEEQRLKYRYIDLRRPIMQNNLLLRHKVINSAREYFNQNYFLEIETPALVRSTPEGARDFLVPSRVNKSKFYALPQSPQLYKQILMISGCDRYYQVAKCLRDEDLRADRQPEHTQFDFEMSFVNSEDIIEFVEGLLKHILKNASEKDIETPFQRITYEEAISKYGTDKPDLRYGLELTDVSEIVKNSDFSVFKQAVEKGGIVKCINPQQDFNRKEIDSLIEFCQKNGAKGMAWMRVTKNGLESNIAKYFSEETKKSLIDATNAKPGSMLMFIADKPDTANKVLDLLRQELAQRLDLIKDEFRFCWVTDFPLFSWDEDIEGWVPEHHMFSMPKPEHMKYLDTDPGKIKGDLFDLVLNGVELGSGSIRIHDPKIQKKVMQIIGMSEAEAQEKFGFLLDAYQYGAPVHGGMGLGIDRFVVLMLGKNDIREVIAFPKNKAAQCPMDGSPSEVPKEQLKELNIKQDNLPK